MEKGYQDIWASAIPDSPASLFQELGGHPIHFVFSP